MAQQIFSFNLKRLERAGKMKPYKLGRNVHSISHLFFADDMLIFSNGRLSSLRNLKKLPQIYESSSCQQINLQKSSMFLSKQICGRKLARVQQVLECKVKQFPFNYLGAPLYKGRCKAEYFDRVIQIISNKLEGWKSKFMSFAGKITLIKSVLASIPVHTLSCMAVPKSIILRLENLMKAFLWSQHGEKRLSWVAWDEVCTPYNEGGLGIRALKDTVYGLQGKLAWKVYTGNTLWTKLLRQKYGSNFNQGAYTRQQSASALWRQIYPHFQNFEEIGQWSVGQGRISFWKDNWLGTILDKTNSSNITVQEGLLELEKWKPALTEDQWFKAKAIVTDDQIKDELRCTLSPSGKFRIADYVKKYQRPKAKKWWSDIMWNKYSSFRVNAFNWKIMRRAIPVDRNVQMRGIALVSRCVCCSNPKVETLEHLMIHSDIAKMVW